MENEVLSGTMSGRSISILEITNSKGETIMTQKILQINFRLSVPAKDYEQACLPAAQPIADTPGLRWKVWLMDEANHEAGGIYLFDDEKSVRAFLDGPIVAAVKSNPAISNISAKTFDVMDALSAVTRAPMREGSRV
jgi:hypothetical protein